ncbi:MAG: carbohydrate binding domain-containing protein [Candidatus Sumerlaeia bacterium]
MMFKSAGLAFVLAVFQGICFAQTASAAASEPPRFQDRFAFIFGWNLWQDSDVTEIVNLLDTGAQHGLNGAAMSLGFENFSLKSAAYLSRLDAVRAACERNRVELIPTLFSVGYGGPLTHDRNLAEGVPVSGALFVASGAQANFVAEDTAQIVNGGFEDAAGNVLSGFFMQDQPGAISFVDTQVKHAGNSSLRLENFTALRGMGRVMQEVAVRPRRCYRVSFWVKTEGLNPAGGFQFLIQAAGRDIVPRRFTIPSTVDWQKISLVFNSMAWDTVRIYMGVWGGISGKVWLDDWAIEEVGPINVLRRPGTPVTVRSEDGATTYVEGLDYAPLVDGTFNFYNVDRAIPALQLLPGGRIGDGRRLRVSWYHPVVLFQSQVTVCMAEPALYRIYDTEARAVAERLHPRRVLLSMDEIRMGGSCRACAGRNMGALLGDCITSQTRIIRRYMPDAEVYIWSDMLDPTHNAHGDYYLVEGDYTGSWNHVPKDLIVAVWGAAPRAESMRFFADNGFQTLASCYYDTADLTGVEAWLALSRTLPNTRGLMYTTWQKKYALLPGFGDLLGGPASAGTGCAEWLKTR